MGESEDPLASLLKVTSWTTIIQQKIPCSTHKHLRHPQNKWSGRLGKGQRWGLQTQWSPRQQTCLVSARTQEPGGPEGQRLGLSPALPSERSCEELLSCSPKVGSGDKINQHVPTSVRQMGHSLHCAPRPRSKLSGGGAGAAQR